MPKKIIVDFNVKKELMKTCHVTYPTIRSALNFKSDTALARRIRQIALKDFGGVEVKN